MFIQTEATGDPEALRFLPGRAVTGAGTRHFADWAAAEAGSPLAARLLAVEGVVAVALGAEHITVTRAGGVDWAVLKPALLQEIATHFAAGEPVLVAALADDDRAGQDDDGLVAKVAELIDTRIQPAVAQSGGAIDFRGIEDGVVLLALEGRAVALKQGIENMLRHYLPEIVAVRDYEEHVRLQSASLNTPQALAVRRVLDEDVNPAVSGHGGHIALLDVSDNTAYIRLEGGCQGCGMADVTLKQGVEAAIRRAVPSIVAVTDTTDHAGGANPYYQPGKGGMSPI